MEIERVGGRLGRLLRLALALDGCRHGVTTQEIADRGGISDDTARRDIRALEDAGFPVIKCGRRWRFMDGYHLCGAGRER